MCAPEPSLMSGASPSRFDGSTCKRRIGRHGVNHWWCCGSFLRWCCLWFVAVGWFRCWPA